MLKKKLAAALAIVILSVGAYTVPALAKDGISDDTNSTTTTTHTTDSNTESKDSTTSNSTAHKEQVAKVEQETHKPEVESHKDTLETETETEINDMVKNHSKHSDADRQRNCQAAQQGLETKFQNVSNNATSFQTKIDTAFANAVAYQKDHNITVADFDQLVATATAAQSKAAASVSVLNGLSPTLDCTQSTVSTTVAKFKVAAKQAKTDLLAYKDAVKAILQAIQAVKGGN